MARTDIALDVATESRGRLSSSARGLRDTDRRFWVAASGYLQKMTITNALASLAVRDLAASSKWYEKLLGSGSQPMSEVMEWRLERGGGLQIYELPERAGQGSCTLIVSDIDEIAQQLRSAELAANPEPARNDLVDTIMIKDPDGNSIAFAMPKDAMLAH